MLFTSYNTYGCATETCDARGRWRFMRELHFFYENTIEVEDCPKLLGRPHLIL